MNRPTTTEIDATEARNSFGRLLERVLRGEEVVILRFGRPAARLVVVGDDGRPVHWTEPVEAGS